VLELCPFDFILYLAIPEGAFKGDELPATSFDAQAF
jgi:hypothetical protein